MAVTRSPHDFRIVPMLLAMIPLPMPEMTPPVTRMYFIGRGGGWVPAPRYNLKGNKIKSQGKESYSQTSKAGVCETRISEAHSIFPQKVNF